MMLSVPSIKCYTFEGKLLLKKKKISAEGKYDT